MSVGTWVNCFTRPEPTDYEIDPSPGREGGGRRSNQEDEVSLDLGECEFAYGADSTECAAVITPIYGARCGAQCFKMATQRYSRCRASGGELPPKEFNPQHHCYRSGSSQDTGGRRGAGTSPVSHDQR